MKDSKIHYETSQNRKKQLMKGAKRGLPIVIGYLPIAISFGVIASQTGIPLLHTVLMSFMVYAGASQFMAANMLAMGVLGFEIVFATFILNFRHFIMSMSLMNRLQHLSTLEKIPLAFGITDETFALISLEDDDSKEISYYFIAGTMLSAYFSWGLGTLLGGLLSMIIPASVGNSMSVGLYAMFIGLLMPSVKKNYKVGFIAVIAGGLSYLFNLYLSSGWSIVFATLLSGFIGSFIIEGE